MSEHGLSQLFSWRGSIVASNLPSGTRLVALVLSLHMNERGGSCFPSQETLAEETGLSERQVRRHIQVLQDEQWLSVTRKPSKKGLRCLYTAEVPIEGFIPKDPPDMGDRWVPDMGDR